MTEGRKKSRVCELRGVSMGLKKNERESFMEKVVSYLNSIGILAQDSYLGLGSVRESLFGTWVLSTSHC